MFNQLLNAVENLAQPQPHPHPQNRSRAGRSSSQELPPERPERPSRSSSLDRPSAGRSAVQSTGNLAESALSNLRKSLVSQRPFSVVSPERRSSPQPDRELRPVGKLNLEDRLRASFAIGEASTSTTPDVLSHAPSPRPGPSPRPTETFTHPLSPTSMPLPDSIINSPTSEDELTLAPLVLPAGSAPDEPPEGVNAVSVDGVEDEEDAQKPPDGEPLLEPSHKELTSPAIFLHEEPNEVQPPALGSSARTPVIIPGEEGEEDAPSLLQKINVLEKRLAELTQSVEHYHAVLAAADAIVSEFTPVASITEAQSLRDHLRDLHLQQEASQDEVKKLNSKIRTFDERIEELRDTHRLESHSQSEQVESLRKQVEEAEALLKSAQNSTAQADEQSRKRQAELEQMRIESQKFKDAAKEEEEKRVKAISLLKTVRQKLVKAEKDRDEALKDAASLRDKERAEREREREERAKLEKELEAARADKEKDIAGLKAHFDRELTTVRERLDKEHAARKGQLELEVASIKAAHQKEIASRNSRIQSLETSVRSLGEERDSLFDQLQMRQAELESSQSHLESLQSGTSELQFQLREATERAALLAEELSEGRREQELRQLRPVESAEEASRIRASIESKYEAKLSELNSRLTSMDMERAETEAALSRNLQQKVQELEALRKLADTSAQSKGQSDDEVAGLQRQVLSLQQEVSRQRSQLVEFERCKDRVNELEAAMQQLSSDFSARSENQEREMSEFREREAQLRTANKTLREELRKVQASAALLERQRNPGVGYWSSFGRQENSSEARLSSPSSSDVVSPSRTASPTPGKNDEELNLEYLRNVILQFLEHKEMRPHLVRVLSIILHFTPQETRRLIAKSFIVHTLKEFLSLRFRLGGRSSISPAVEV